MSSCENVKVVLLGEQGVGKTCIINRFISDEFNENTMSSLSAQFISKTIELKDIKKFIKFEIWDTAGQEKFHSLAKIFYRDAKVICLVYDITDRESFENLKSYWYESELKLNLKKLPILAVVGNKNDLYENKELEENVAEDFAKSIHAIFQYTSAKNSSGIEELFDKIGHKYFNPDLNAMEDEEKERELYEKKKAEKELNKKDNKNNLKLNEVKIKKQGKKCC